MIEVYLGAGNHIFKLYIFLSELSLLEEKRKDVLALQAELANKVSVFKDTITTLLKLTYM